MTIELTHQLTADGFVVSHGPFSNALIEQLLTVSHERICIVKKALGDKEIGIGSAAGYDEIVQRSPSRWDLPISPQEFGVDDRDLPWWPLVKATLGPDAEHSFSGVVYSDPGSPAQEWHMDSPHESDRHLPPHAVNVLVALHDISMEMGPTEFARGSHTLTNHLKNTSLVRDELIYQHATTSPAMLVDGTDRPVPESSVDEMPTGTWVLFDDRLMHRGLANQTDVTRYMAYFSYRKSGYAGNTHFEAQRSVFD
jgi:hypothetical protein